MPVVLFVSHSADLRAVASRVLTRAGCRVTAVAHAGHALVACIESNTFDVLVIEDHMPEASGETIARRLRRFCPGVQVVRMCDTKPAAGGKEITVVRPFTADDLIGAVSDATHYTRRRTTSL
jgi:CheY-like chemotaxis protein